MEHSKANTNENNVKQMTANNTSNNWHDVDTRYKPIKLEGERLERVLAEEARAKKERMQREYTLNKGKVEPSVWRRINRGYDAVLRQQISTGQRQMPFYIGWKCESNPIYNASRPRGKALKPDCGKWSFKRATELPETAHADGRRSLAVCQHCKKKASLVSRGYLIFDTKLQAKTYCDEVHRINEAYDKKYRKWLDE